MPWDLPGATIPEDPGARFAHLGAVSVDARGRPLRIFTTNRWVTDETLYRAADVVGLIPRFSITTDRPTPAISRWLNGMVTLFGPQFEPLQTRRDAVLADGAARRPGADLPEDRRLQNSSETPIDIAAQIAAVEAAPGL